MCCFCSGSICHPLLMGAFAWSVLCGVFDFSLESAQTGVRILACSCSAWSLIRCFYILCAVTNTHYAAQHANQIYYFKLGTGRNWVCSSETFVSFL